MLPDLFPSETYFRHALDGHQFDSTITTLTNRANDFDITQIQVTVFLWPVIFGDRDFLNSPILVPDRFQSTKIIDERLSVDGVTLGTR